MSSARLSPPGSVAAPARSSYVRRSLAAAGVAAFLATGAAACGTPAPSDAQLYRLRICESGGNYRINTGNGYYGAYQFSLATWRSLGYGGYPHQAAPAVQDAAVRKLYARAGWSPWPVCGRRAA